MVKVQAGEMPTHFQDQHRQRKRRADPEPPGHVDQFSAGSGVCAAAHRLQRHAADRTVSGRCPPNLWMHRAGVNHVFLWGMLLLRFSQLQIFGGFGQEFGATSRAAEMVARSVVLRAMLRCRRVHHHAADGIAFLRRSRGRSRGDAMPVVMFMMVRHGQTACSLVGKDQYRRIIRHSVSSIWPLNGPGSSQKGRVAAWVA